MCCGEIADVDVVADAGAVWGVVVRGEDLRSAALGQCGQDEGEEVVGTGVVELQRPGTGYVEVPQRGGTRPSGPSLVTDQPLPDELALPVGRLRESGSALRDEAGPGHAVHGGRRGEDHVPRPDPLHGGEQVSGPRDVLLVDQQRVPDGLPGILVPGQVHDTADVVVAKRLRHGAGVQDVGVDERDRAGHERAVAADERVEGHDGDAGVVERPEDVGPDVPAPPVTNQITAAARRPPGGP